MKLVSNVDPEEIKKFNALAREWWDPAGPMQALHQLNPHRLAFVKKHSSLLGLKVLDVGCGGGIFSEALAQENALVKGIDLSPEVLKVAEQHSQRQGLSIDYDCIALEALETEKTFDIICCMELLEHVPDPQRLIQDCARLTKAGGLVFFSTLNRKLKSYLLAILGAEYLLKLLPIGTHHYAQFIKPSELRQWANAAHLKMVDLQGIRYHPLSQSFSLSNDTDVNYMMCFRHEV